MTTDPCHRNVGVHFDHAHLRCEAGGSVMILTIAPRRYLVQVYLLLQLPDE